MSTDSLAAILKAAEEQRHSQDGNHVVLEAHEWDIIYKALTQCPVNNPPPQNAR